MPVEKMKEENQKESSEGSRPRSSRALTVPVEKMKEENQKESVRSSREGSDQQKEDKLKEHNLQGLSVLTLPNTDHTLL